MPALTYLYTRYIIKRNKSLFHRKDGGRMKQKIVWLGNIFFLLLLLTILIVFFIMGRQPVHITAGTLMLLAMLLSWHRFRKVMRNK